MLRRLDRLVWGWIDRYSDHVQRLAGLCVFAGVLLFARAAYAQTPGDLQRQIDRLDRDVQNLQQKAEQTRVDADRTRLEGFQRLAAVERQVAVLTQNVARIENYLLGALLATLGNVGLSLTTTATVRKLRAPPA